MDIADVSLTALSRADYSNPLSRNMPQAVGLEFDAMFIGLLLQSGSAHALGGMDGDQPEMSVWSDLFVHSLAQELARSGELAVSKSLLAGTVPPGGGDND